MAHFMPFKARELVRKRANSFRTVATVRGTETLTIMMPGRAVSVKEVVCQRVKKGRTGQRPGSPRGWKQNRNDAISQNSLFEPASRRGLLPAFLAVHS